MSACWRIRADDESGRYWLSGERLWSDSVDDGIVFTVEDEARTLALEIETRVGANPDRSMKIKVVSFRA
jgi:hypothetical protein